MNEKKLSKDAMEKVTGGYEILQSYVVDESGEHKVYDLYDDMGRHIETFASRESALEFADKQKGNRHFRNGLKN